MIYISFSANNPTEQDPKLKKDKKQKKSKKEKKEKLESMLDDEFIVVRVTFLSSAILSLNVGGKKFSTTLDTLRSDANSMLTAMFSGKYKLRKDAKGIVDLQVQMRRGFFH